MGRRAAGGLVAKPEPETLKVQVPRDLLDQLGALDERLSREAPDMQFDRSAVVEDALRTAVRKANQSLDSRANRSTT